MADQQNDNGQLLPKVDDSGSPIKSDDTQSDIPLNKDLIDQGVAINDNQADNAEAGDVDVIEKAWIDKAKHIVDQTSSDPFEQQKMISKVKADYIKKRFNKDIKIDTE